MASRLVLLVPPSLSMVAGGHNDSPHEGVFDSRLAVARRYVRDALSERLNSANVKELEKIFHARANTLSRARSVTASMLANEGPTLPAWQRFSGVVWRHLDAATMPASARRRLLIPSGLYGLVSGDDRICEYRLAMNVRLSPLPSLGNFWRPAITQLLCESAPEGTLVDLLPVEHASSIDFVQIEQVRRVIHVRFETSDHRRVVGHDAKAVKGIVARHLLVDGLKGLDSMSWRGWHVRCDDNHVVVTAPR